MSFEIDDPVSRLNAGARGRGVWVDGAGYRGARGKQRRELNAKVFRPSKLDVEDYGGASQVRGGQEIHPPGRPLPKHMAGL